MLSKIYSKKAAVVLVQENARILLPQNSHFKFIFMRTRHYYTVSSSSYIFCYKVANYIQKRPYFQENVMIFEICRHVLDKKAVC